MKKNMSYVSKEKKKNTFIMRGKKEREKKHIIK